MAARHRSLALALVLALAGCDDAPDVSDAGPPDAGVGFESACENINASHCLLPWPSSRFLAEDPSTATGFRIAIDQSAMPINASGVQVDPAQLTRFDGFSPAGSIMTSFAGLVDASLLNGEEAIEATLSPSSTTVIIDAETGELFPHFAELDAWPATDPERAPLYLRPARRLEEGHRYVVGISGLRTVDGAPIEPTAYFAALRDGTDLPGTDVADRRAAFDDVFGVLEDAGVERGGLIEAWDFVTASGETLWGDLLAMRDDAVGRGAGDWGQAGERGIGCAVTRVDDVDLGDDVPAPAWRRIYGTVTVPLYLVGESPESVEESRIHRGADGRPEMNGTAEVPFVAQIPLSVRDAVAAGGPGARLEVYGHGQFGSRQEITYGWHRDHQQRLGVVSVAVDWWGMSELDLSRIITTLQEFSTFDATAERLTQAMINQLVLARSFTGVCSELPEMQVTLTAGGTAPAIDPSFVYYYGNSQGGILGGTLAGVAVDIDRFVLGVGAMGYPMMIKRSVNWNEYDAVMEVGYPDPFDRDLLLVVSSPLWDLGEATSYAPHLVADPLPGTPPKHVLMQIGIGDAQVPNVGSAVEARTIGLPLLTPSPLTPWGLETATAPLDSALVVYQIPGSDPAMPGTRNPGMDNTAHEGVRRSTAAMDQIDAFARPDGTVTQTCDGVCDPT